MSNVGKFAIMKPRWGDIKVVEITRETAQFFWVKEVNWRPSRTDKSAVHVILETQSEARALCDRAQAEWKARSAAVTDAENAVRAATSARKDAVDRILTGDLP